MGQLGNNLVDTGGALMVSCSRQSILKRPQLRQLADAMQILCKSWTIVTLLWLSPSRPQICAVEQMPLRSSELWSTAGGKQKNQIGQIGKLIGKQIGQIGFLNWAQLDSTGSSRRFPTCGPDSFQFTVRRCWAVNIVRFCLADAFFSNHRRIFLPATISFDFIV